MTALDSDVIVARSTPSGHGALAVVRLSGPAVLSLAKDLCPGAPSWVARRASLRLVRDAEDGVLDDALVTWMPGPHTYTGEDVVELSCHGNPALVDAVLARCVVLGARPARPGEFTRRAVVHGRLDLVQAEAIDGLIRARTMAGVRAARAGVDGVLDETLRGLRDRLLDAGAELEARLDHPGEELGELEDAELADVLNNIGADCERLAGTWSSVERRIEGATVALVGPVNAGKSSLFNHLVGSRRALVSAEPGTTRDAVERTVDWGGVAVTFVDTAGLRSGAGAIEAAGIALGTQLATEADLRLRLYRPGQSSEDTPLPAPTWTIATHADVHQDSVTADFFVSNTTEIGLGALRDALDAWLSTHDPAGAAVVGSQRQADLLLKMAEHAREAAELLLSPIGPVVAAESVTAALERLGAMRGHDVREDVLDRLFARFCIGK